MGIFVDIIGFLYLLVLSGLALYGLHNLFTTILYLRVKAHPRNREIEPLDEWPPVTIQLPIFNEKYTVERLLRSVTALDYPEGLLQIQVLDDSTDDTAQLVRRLADQYKARGVNIECIHRDNRQGYKAGALDAGLRSATRTIYRHFRRGLRARVRLVETHRSALSGPETGLPPNALGPHESAVQLIDPR